MPICKCKDINLYYEVHGDGPPLLLIGGLGGGTWSWYGQVPFFKNHYRTVIYDNRGAGRSDMPPGPYRMEQLARDGLCLLDHLRIDRAFVLGLSMGGMIAQELALLSPARIRALLLGCTHCGGRLRIPPSPDTIQVLLNNQGLSHEQIIEKNLPIFLSKACLRDHIEIAQAYQQAQLATPLQPEHAFQAQLAAISAFDCSERVSEIKVPTLVVAGSEDLLIPQDNAHTLAQRIAQAELIMIPGAGHALHAECRAKLNTIAHDFFQRHTGD